MFKTSTFDADVYIGRTKRTGIGVFAKRSFKKSESIFVVKGRLIKQPYDPRHASDGPYWIGVGKERWIEPAKGSPGWYINHSCAPNVGLRGRVRVVAMRNIKPKEEITIDYSTTEADPYWHMKSRCRCGAPGCRQVIKGIQYLPERRFRKYKLFIPRWVQKEYLVSRVK